MDVDRQCLVIRTGQFVTLTLIAYQISLLGNGNVNANKVCLPIIFNVEYGADDKI